MFAEWKNYYLAVIAGFLAGFFLSFTIDNISALSSVPSIRVYLLFGLPVLFLIVTWIFTFLSRTFSKLGFLKQAGKFLMVGFLNTTVDFGIINSLISYTGIVQGSTLVLFNTISFSIAVTNSYFWNRMWVFENKEDASVGQFSKFVITTLISLLINNLIVYTLATHVTPLFGLDQKTWVNLAKAFATAFTMVWNFLGYKFVVFRAQS